MIQSAVLKNSIQNMSDSLDISHPTPSILHPSKYCRPTLFCALSTLRCQQTTFSRVLAKPKTLLQELRCQSIQQHFTTRYKLQEGQQKLQELVQYYKFYRNTPLVKSKEHLGIMCTYWNKIKTLYYKEVKKTLEITPSKSKSIGKDISADNTHSKQPSLQIKAFCIKDHFQNDKDPDSTLRNFLKSLSKNNLKKHNSKKHKQISNKQFKSLNKKSSLIKQKMSPLVAKQSPLFKRQSESKNVNHSRKMQSCGKMSNLQKSQSKVNLRSNPSHIISVSSFNNMKVHPYKSSANTKKLKASQVSWKHICQNIFENKPKEKKKKNKKVTVTIRQSILEKALFETKQKNKSCKKSQSKEKATNKQTIKITIKRVKDKIQQQKDIILRHQKQSRQSYAKSIDSTCGENLKAYPTSESQHLF